MTQDIRTHVVHLGFVPKRLLTWSWRCNLSVIYIIAHLALYKINEELSSSLLELSATIYKRHLFKQSDLRI